MDVTNERDQAYFIDAYIECALWSSTADGAPGMGENDDTSFQSYGYDRDDLAASTYQIMADECLAFMKHNAEDLQHWDAEQAGHDFWLTRNGHGAGFWDRYYGGHPLEAVGDRLTESCRPYGEVYLYVGEDELIYGD